ncbi:MAG: polysulfide reductase NrfD [Deltaproteobacteria bacterium]|nr:polysulfide reductase NrfD [Deltaproteobacteria bacterium]
MSQLTYGNINDKVVGSLEPPGRSWIISMAVFLVALGMGVFALTVQIRHGLEWSGVNHPIAWGVYITNFVFWIEIGHGGTLVSAVLFLARARFRNSICRTSEAMTVFAVMTAGLFPLIHLGRSWVFYWLIPYPNQRELWVNFKSPLLWDVFAVGTYLSVSMVFFVLGLLPDLAAVGDESRGLKRLFYRMAAIRFRGTNHQWLHYVRGYLLFAAIAAALIFSVASIVSWDFAVSSLPGWHATIFGPYFLAGAIFSGCAMLLVIVIPMRRVFPGFQELIKVEDLESVGKMLIFTSLILTYVYAIEFFMAYYSGARFERAIFWFRSFGEMKQSFWLVVVCNSIVPIFLWFRKVRSNIPALFIISLVILVGMWLERFVIVISSTAHGFDPFAWASYRFEWAEIWITIGSFGWFFMWIFLMVKIVPFIALSEMKEGLIPPFRIRK